VEAVLEISEDEVTRMRAIEREIFLMDQASLREIQYDKGLQEGLREGRQEGRQEGYQAAQAESREQIRQLQEEIRRLREGR
jgi:flagellar biosynthesis/type III secretory pathway protein FliH